jgi:NitT/TauT family transport system ATP-binding protein
VSLIQVTGAAKRYAVASGEVAALDPVSLTVNEGEFVSILGPSGCGKSTFMLMLAGLISRSAGTIEIDGVKVDRPYTDLGIVFQDHNLLEWRSVLSNVMLQIEVRGRDPAQYLPRAQDLLRMVGLDGAEGRLPHELSGGMRQRAAICRALIHEPRLLLMDEPFGALDAQTRSLLQSELLEVWERTRKTVVFVTHGLDEALTLSDRIVLLSARPGRIVADLPIDAPRPRDPQTDPTLRAAYESLRDLLAREVESVARAEHDTDWDGVTNRPGTGDTFGADI